MDGLGVSGGVSGSDSAEAIGNLQLCGVGVRGTGGKIDRVSHQPANLGKPSVSYCFSIRLDYLQRF